MIRPSYPMLAISIGSEYKEAAWEFIVGFLDEQYQKELTYELPVRRSVLEGALLENREPEYETDAEGNQKMKPRSEIIFEGEEPVELYCVTEKQADELIDLIESATVCATTDFQLYFWRRQTATLAVINHWRRQQRLYRAGHLSMSGKEKDKEVQPPVL